MLRDPRHPSTADRRVIRHFARSGMGTNVLAFDYGLRRIGVAVGERSTRSSSPLGSIAVTRAGPDWQAIERLLRDWEPDLLLVGVPGSPEGEPGSFAPAALGFAEALRERFALPVETADETLTSREARELLREERRSGRRTRRVRRGDVDPLAAQLMLRGWLDAHDGRT